jgi:lipopolysaccharide transport system permease protein
MTIDMLRTLRPADAERPVTRIVSEGGGPRFNWRELWAYRDLLVLLIWRDIMIRYKQTVVGVTWVILQPVAATVVFSLLFARLVPQAAGTELPYPLFVFAGLAPWTYLTHALTKAGNSIVDHQSIITKVRFFPGSWRRWRRCWPACSTWRSPCWCC